MPRFRKKYHVNLVIWVEPDAPFLELANGDNEDVVMQVLKDTIYDLDDISIAEIEVEHVDYLC